MENLLDVVEEPIVEEPIVEEPIVEEPIVEEPIVEEPIVEEPIVENVGLEDFTLEELEITDGGEEQLEVVNNMLKELREGKVSPKDLIKDIIADERASSKKQLEAVREIRNNPPKGIDIKEMTQWVSKQSSEVQTMVQNLTSANLPPETIRSGLELLKLFRTKGVRVGGGDTKITKTESVTREGMLSEYEEIFKYKSGHEQVQAMEKLIKKGTSTGDDELATWTKQMFS